MATRMDQQSPAEQTTRPMGRGSCSSRPFSTFSSATSITARSSPMLTSSTRGRCAISVSTAISCMPRPGGARASCSHEIVLQHRQQDQYPRRRRPARWRAFRFVVGSGTASVLDLRRKLATIGREFTHDLLVQPDIHAGGNIDLPVLKDLFVLLPTRHYDETDIELVQSGD